MRNFAISKHDIHLYSFIIVMIYIYIYIYIYFHSFLILIFTKSRRNFTIKKINKVFINISTLYLSGSLSVKICNNLTA